MYQAGIKQIILYENKGIDFNYYDPLLLNAISNLTGQGSIITIENVQQPEFDIESELAESGEVIFDYTVEFLFLGYTFSNISLISELKKSIYGWCFLVEFYDGTYKFYNSPVYCRDSEIKPQDEMSFKLSLKSTVGTTQQHLDYTPGISTIPVYRADTTLLTADNTIYTADYAL